MPHFGLMDEDALGPVEGPLMRAKLHYRCGKRRLREDKISLGIVTLYDAVIFAMQWYIAVPGHVSSLQVKEGDDMKDDKIVYRVLTGSRVLDGTFDYDAFDKLTEKAVYQDISSFDYTEMLKGVDSVLTQLGVLPFDESELPPEDPKTV
ncbi:MAG: hypothetical protein C4538_01035 [Nitrospiraceae bacterium]|nr:MAG: hypothetical protein C4538_01035 [Nitrospiraceae bacterium]